MPIITEKEKWRAINDTYANTVKMLTQERIKKGWSKYWLAIQANLAIPTISNFENNETRASFETIIAIALALNVPLINITDGSTQK